MIVFIGGMQRSGSTFCFNVARELLNDKGALRCEATDYLNLTPLENGGVDHVLIKSHSASTELLDAILAKRVKSIVSVRPVAEAVASCVEIWGIPLDAAIANLKLWHRMYHVIGPASLRIEYDTIDSQPVQAAMRIADYLELDGNIKMITEKYSKDAVRKFTEDMNVDQPNVIDAGFSFYDNSTFFHRQHVISSAKREPREIFSAADIARIKKEFADLS